MSQAKSLGERVTPNKLVEAWKGKGPPVLRVKEITTPNLTQDQCERLVLHLLLKGFIKEEFHFTPYSTISYLVKGTRADMVMRGLRVKMELRECDKPTVSREMDMLFQTVWQLCSRLSHLGSQVLIPGLGITSCLSHGFFTGFSVLFPPQNLCKKNYICELVS